MPPLTELLSLPHAERLDLGRRIARALGPTWRASDRLVGATGMIELVHASGHAFVAIGGASFERGLRDREREALITAMRGPRADSEDADEHEAARARVAGELPRAVMAPAIVEVPAYLIGREPLSVVRAPQLGPGTLEDLGYPEALGDAATWRAFVERLPDGLRLPTEDEWELVAREGGATSWIVPVPVDGFAGLWPPEEVFAHENALGVRALAIAEVFANGFRRGVGDGRGNWGGSTGNAELHAAARWPDGYGASRLARTLSGLGARDPR